MAHCVNSTIPIIMLGEQARFFNVKTGMYMCVCVFDVMCHSLLSDEPFFINCHNCYYFHDKFCSKYEVHVAVINLFATSKTKFALFL